MAYGVLARLGLNQYAVKKKAEITSGAQERRDSALNLHGLSVLVLQG